MTPEREAEIRAAWVDGRYGPKWEVGFFCDAVDDLLKTLDATRAENDRMRNEINAALVKFFGDTIAAGDPGRYCTPTPEAK